jgi:hypothetical protein
MSESTEPTLKELEALVAEQNRARKLKLDAAEVERKTREMKERLKLPEIEGKYGLVGRDIEPVFCPKTGAMVVVKTPTEAAWQKLTHLTSTMRAKPSDLGEFLSGVLVYPSEKELGKITEDSPAILDLATNAAGKLAGMNGDEREGK